LDAWLINTWMVLTIMVVGIIFSLRMILHPIGCLEVVRD
jgi:hypothetical protein